MSNRMRPPHQAPHHQSRIYAYTEVKIGKISEQAPAENDDGQCKVKRERIKRTQIARSWLNAVRYWRRLSLLGGNEICGRNLSLRLPGSSPTLHLPAAARIDRPLIPRARLSNQLR